jgi:hypothetical protein
MEIAPIRHKNANTKLFNIKGEAGSDSAMSAGRLIKLSYSSRNNNGNGNKGSAHS